MPTTTSSGQLRPGRSWRERQNAHRRCWLDVYQFCPHARQCPHYDSALCHRFFRPPKPSKGGTVPLPGWIADRAGLNPPNYGRRPAARPSPCSNSSRPLKPQPKGASSSCVVDNADLSSSGWERRATQTSFARCEYVADRVMEAVRTQEMNTAIRRRCSHAAVLDQFGASRPTARSPEGRYGGSVAGSPAVTPRLAARHSRSSVFRPSRCGSRSRPPRSRRGSCAGLPAGHSRPFSICPRQPPLRRSAAERL